MVASGNPQQFAPRLPAGVQLGNFVLGPALWPLRIADAYRANGPSGPATVYVVHAPIAQHAGVREHIVAGTRVAAALAEHKHLVRTLAAGLTGDILWIATEEVDGQLVRDMLVKKKQSGTSGFGARGTGNLIAGVAGALADANHGALAAESVVVSRSGRVRVADLALGPGTLAAIHAGLVPASSSLAPELATGGSPSGPGDVYAGGALLYEALVGTPLERGGPRPSDVVPGTNQQIDEIVARACHRDPEKRFGRADVLGEVIGEALGAGGERRRSPCRRSSAHRRSSSTCSRPRAWRRSSEAAPWRRATSSSIGRSPPRSPTRRRSGWSRRAASITGRSRSPTSSRRSRRARSCTAT